MEYVAPTTLNDAVRLAIEAEGSVRYLAGGTDVLVQLRTGIFRPDLMIDLKRIDGMLDVVRTAEGGWRIGAAVPGTTLAKIDGLREDWPGIVESMELIGSTQIQGRASLVGNLCNASPAADSVPALVAAEAEAEIIGSNGVRREPVSTITSAPGKTTLKKGEIISFFHLPKRDSHSADAYLRFIPRTEMDIAVVGCAVNLTVKGEKVAVAKVALGAVAPTVIEVPQAANVIIGKRLDDNVVNAYRTVCQDACKPISDKRGTVDFRISIAGVLAERSLKIAFKRANKRK